MGVGDIISSHKPALSKDESKEKKEKVEEIVKELVNEPPPQPKPRGRPRKNSTEEPPPRPKSPSKSPSRKDEVPLPPPPQQQQKTPEEIADGIANRAIIRQLRVYCRRFPQFAPDPGYNPHYYSARQNRLVIDAIKEAVRAEVEFLTAPALISESIRNAEGMALAWAVTNPDNPASGTIKQLHSVADAVLNDPAVDLDIGLLECELTGFMPESPIIRILLNIGRVVARVWTENQVHTVIPPQASTENEKKFAEF